MKTQSTRVVSDPSEQSNRKTDWRKRVREQMGPQS